jgi:predicted porin
VKSTLIAGWKREDSERDLEYNLITATTNIGVWPSVSLYREETVSDEIYLNWVARPMPGMTLRIVPSYIWADETALVTVPETSLNLKTALSYSMDNGMVVNAYYNFKDKENGNNSFADTAKPTGGPIVITNEYAQKADDTFNAAGVSFNLSPSDRMNASMGLDWVQNDFETYFFGTNRRRFETPIVFDPRGISSFKVDTLSLNFNGEYQASDRMKLSAGYAYSKSDGDIRTTGLEADGDPAENQNDKVDHTLQSILLGVEYGLQKSMSVRGSYVFDKYDDDAYDDLSGDAHTLMLGVSFKL